MNKFHRIARFVICNNVKGKGVNGIENTQLYKKNFEDFLILQGKDLHSILFQRSSSFIHPRSTKN